MGSDRYRSMIYVAMGTLHFYRADIEPSDFVRMTQRHFDSEWFIENYHMIIGRVITECRNLFDYDISHLQLCKAVTAYFSRPQSVAERPPFVRNKQIAHDALA